MRNLLLQLLDIVYKRPYELPLQFSFQVQRHRINFKNQDIAELSLAEFTYGPIGKNIHQKRAFTRL